MWGHADTCPCLVCRCLPRIHLLIGHGSNRPGFLDLAARQLRVLECELRDELERVLPHQGSLPTPSAPIAPGGPALREAPATASQAAPEKEGPDHKLQTTPKSGPPLPPGDLRGSAADTKPEKECTPAEVKEEEKGTSPQESHKEPQDQELSPKESPTRPRSSGTKEREPTHPPVVEKKKKKKKDKDRSQKRKRRSSDSRGRRERRSPKRSRSHGRERKTRSERPPEPDRPPARDRYWWPSEPAYPPQRGAGWRGPVPWSDHPRWREGQNKGQVKRAKQERYNNRSRR